jgi:hypothetical protein
MAAVETIFVFGKESVRLSFEYLKNGQRGGKLDIPVYLSKRIDGRPGDRCRRRQLLQIHAAPSLACYLRTR